MYVLYEHDSKIAANCSQPTYSSRGQTKGYIIYKNISLEVVKKYTKKFVICTAGVCLC